MHGISFDHEVAVSVSDTALIALVVDLSRYTEIEPNLVSAQWVAPGPIGVGSVAQIVAEVPFSLVIVRRLIGTQRGIVTVTRWDPPSALGAVFDARGVTVRATMQLNKIRGGGVVVGVRGVITPRNQWVAAALTPVLPMLERLVERSIERGVRRVEAALLLGLEETLATHPSLG